MRGDVNIPPKRIDTNDLSFNSSHVQARNHNVTETQAKEYIKNAEFSITRWNGKRENYYSQGGAAYVDVKTKTIVTAFSSAEYDKRTAEVMEEVNKWKNTL